MGHQAGLSLSNQAAAGARWSVGASAGRQAIQFVTSVVLARLLAASDFGIVAMAAVITNFAVLFADLGTSAALIQRKNLTKTLISSVFWFNFAAGAVVTAVVALLAPVVAHAFEEPRLVPVLRVLSLTFVITGFGISNKAIAERHLAFRALGKIDLASIAISAVAGITAAVSGWGVWSLVCQALALALANTILIWALFPLSLEISISLPSLRGVFGFSMNLTGFNVVNYFIRNSDNVLVGRFLGASQLGYYGLAYRLLMFPLQAVSASAGRVIFSICSQIQDDDLRIRRGYLRATGAIAALTFPLMLGATALAEPLILAVFGAKWAPSILPVMILAPVGMFQSIGATVGPLYQAKGRTDLLFAWGCAAGVLTIAGFCVGIRWGIVGVAAAYAIASALLILPSFAIPFRLIGLRMREFLPVIGRPLAASAIMAGVLSLALRQLPVQISEGWRLAMLMPLGIVTYGAAAWIISRDQVLELRELVRTGR